MIKIIAKYFLNLFKFFTGRTEYIRLPVLLGRAVIFNPYKKSIKVLRVNSSIDITTLDHIFSQEQYNLKNWQQYKYLIKQNDGHKKYLLDLGANAGYASQYFSEQILELNIIAIEPEENNFKTAKINLLQNKNVELLLGAIGGSSGVAGIKDEYTESNAFQVDRTVTSAKNLIRIYSVSELLNHYDLDKLFIVKIDIEGFEDDLFSVDLEWIDKTDIIIIELHDWLLPFQSKSANFIRAISNRNRDLVIDGENLISFKNYG
ncbi:FkbM family methyltransferase [Amylibacter sp.]|nr:FkbM family methyltransferase [Amylibacter sp.]